MAIRIDEKAEDFFSAFCHNTGNLCIFAFSIKTKTKFLNQWITDY